VATPSMDALTWFRRQVEAADADLLREMITTFAGTLMSAEADALCGAGHGERTPERVNSRNGYRERTWDTRTGTIDLAIPKLRSGSYFPDWLLEQRRRSERALVAVVAECYVRGVSTRRVEGLVRTLGIERLSKSQVSAMAQELDPMVASFRNRPLDPAGYPYLWIDALTQSSEDGVQPEHTFLPRCVPSADSAGLPQAGPVSNDPLPALCVTPRRTTPCRSARANRLGTVAGSHVRPTRWHAAGWQRL